MDNAWPEGLSNLSYHTKIFLCIATRIQLFSRFEHLQWACQKHFRILCKIFPNASTKFKSKSREISFLYKERAFARVAFKMDFGRICAIATIPLIIWTSPVMWVTCDPMPSSHISKGSITETPWNIVLVMKMFFFKNVETLILPRHQLRLYNSHVIM